MSKRRCLKCGQLRQSKFFTTERARVCQTCKKQTRRRAGRNARLASTYGISHDEYDALLASQGGRCGICGGTRSYNLSVDHCHPTERVEGSRASVRGLLCRRCNRLLAQASDSPTILRSAADYLERPPARSILEP